jgi:hypothetical protein
MADITRRIGLSLGADICWPIAFTEILNRLDLAIPVNGDTVRFDVDRVAIEPFDLRERTPYDLVIDRLTHWFHPSREWIKKAVILDDVYVFNNPWNVQAMEKHTAFCALIRLGFPIPETWLIPSKEYEPSPDLEVTLEQYARMFDLGEIGDRIGYPMFMKPYDGGGWRGVSRIEDSDALRTAYEESGRTVMHLQQGIEPYDPFVRCVGLGPQTRLVKYDPTAPHHDRYTMEEDFVSTEDASFLGDLTLTINSMFGWDFNSCESLHRDGTWYPIDFANPCPDSQVTSLHYHFPWMIMANIRWSTFVAATNRQMRTTEWDEFFLAVEEGMTMRERLDATVAIANRRFDTDRFEEFCGEHLADLEDVAVDFFKSEASRDAIREKVVSLFPEHDVDEYTNLFFDRIQLAIERLQPDRSGSPTS